MCATRRLTAGYVARFERHLAASVERAPRPAQSPLVTHRPPVRASRRIAIVGGGPSALFLFKHLVDAAVRGLAIDIFEARTQPGSGMPYSAEGANSEHITNVSCNELPPLVTTVEDYIRAQPAERLATFGLTAESFSEYRVLPRLLFGEYLAEQFALLEAQAVAAGIHTRVHCMQRVVDIIDDVDADEAHVVVEDGTRTAFDDVAVCTGHVWPHAIEDAVPGYFESPYPPTKLARRFNDRIAIRGSSLTAVDAIRTLARHNGRFERDAHGDLTYVRDELAPAFRIVMHSRNGLLPAIRFHVDSPQLGTGSLITDHDVAVNMAANDGFLSLDFLFEKNFKQPLRERDPEFYERIRGLSIEGFVARMLGLREAVEPFAFFKGEFAEAAKSIRRRESVHWKEMLSTLSFAMNYPAKHMSAEDMLRHQRVLMPLIAVVIAFLPQGSARELIAMHEAGCLELVTVGDDSEVVPNAAGGVTYRFHDDGGAEVELVYPMFVDCIGQRHLSIDAFPFRTLVEQGSVVPARLPFRSASIAKQMMRDGDETVQLGTDGRYYLEVPGLAITDDFQAVGTDGAGNPRLYLMAVPFIGGYNPDYSGLDFCEQAGRLIAGAMLANAVAGEPDLRAS